MIRECFLALDENMTPTGWEICTSEEGAKQKVDQYLKDNPTHIVIVKLKGD